MSTNLMLGLMAVYAVIVGAAAWQRDWPRVLYFVSAIGISAAVMWMGKTEAGG